MGANATDENGRPAGLVWTVADLPRRRNTRFDIVPDTASCAGIAAELGLDGLRKLRFRGALLPLGARDWRLDAQLGATVIQPCGVTLAPVTTRIEETIQRRFLSDPMDENTTPGAEIEMTADETDEPLGRLIDLHAVLLEALALALPAFPRADGVDLGAAVFSEPGLAAMTDDDARPFAGLADLKAKLERGD